MCSCWSLFGSGFIVFGTWYVIAYGVTSGTFAGMPVGLAFGLAAIVAGLLAGTEYRYQRDGLLPLGCAAVHPRRAQRYVYDPPLARLGREFTPPLALRLRVYARNAGRVLSVWMKLGGLWPRCGGR